MNPSDSPLDQAIDRLLADDWQRRQQQTDATALLARVRRSRQSESAGPAMLDDPATQAAATLPSSTRFEPPRPELAEVVRARAAGGAAVESRSPRGWSRSWAWPVLAGLVFLAALMTVRLGGSSTANAAAMLRDLRTVHLGQVDRRYRVQYAPDPRYWNESNRLEGPSNSLMWTRGDRFWSDCAIGDLQLRIGRQGDGTLWIRSTPQQAVEFRVAASELPQEVALLCAVNSLSVPRLVEEVLADFELRAAPPADRSGAAGIVVWASLKPSREHPLISSALLELDPQDHSLTRLVLWMMRDGLPRGTVTYTFLDSGVVDDAQYELRSHVDDDAQIDSHGFVSLQD